MTDETPEATPAEAEPVRIEDAAPAVPAVPEDAAAEREAADCETCGGKASPGPGPGVRGPCPDCISLVPRPAPRHAAAAPEPADVRERKCAACEAAESFAVPMFDAGHALYCASVGDCQRRQDAARAARMAAA